MKRNFHSSLIFNYVYGHSDLFLGQQEVSKWPFEEIIKLNNGPQINGWSSAADRTWNMGTDTQIQ